jgi:hypothetical protein
VLALDARDHLLQGQPLAGYLAFGDRRVDIAKLRDEHARRAIIDRTPCFGSLILQSRDRPRKDRIEIHHDARLS